MSVYRSLLLLFPPSFRRRFGPDMERHFADLVQESRRAGRRLGPVFWVALFWDAVVCSVAEWLEVLLPSGPVTNRSRPSPPRPGDSMSAFSNDVRLALRQTARRPGYAVAVVLLMALGIGGNAAVFRLVNGLFLRPLPFEQPQQLVDLNETAPQWDLEFLSIAYRDFDLWRAENSTFEAMTVTDEGGGNLLVDGEPQRVSYLETTHDIDDVLRISPALGRFYGPDDDRPEAPRVALLSQGYWRRQFGADPGAVGRVLTLDGTAVEVIGVLPERADFVRDVDLWLPLRQTRDDWFGWGLNGVGRLREGVTPEQAQADLLSIHKAAIPEYEVNEISFPIVEALRERYLGDYRLGAGFLLAAVGSVLLIACANIAGLMTIRSMARAEELSVRAALGASRPRLVRQLMTESLLLSTVGAGLGVALGVYGAQALIEPMRDQFPRWISFDLDLRFLLFTVAATSAATVLFGLAPALRASRTAALAGFAGRSGHGRRQNRHANWMVCTEIALALTLLVLGCLALLDVRRLGEVDPGFRADRLLTYQLTLPPSDYDTEARTSFIDEYLPKLEAISGVSSAAAASSLPLSGHWGSFFQVEGGPAGAGDEGDPVVLKRVVTPNYFETVGVEIIAGRGLDAFDDREGGARSVVVNETFVRTHLAHLEDPVGARITEGTSIGDDPQWTTVVGVARDVRHYGVDERMRPGLYFPFLRQPLPVFSVGLRVERDDDLVAVTSQVREATRDLDPALPTYGLEAMTTRLGDSLWARRATAWSMLVFSAVALALAIAGIYGVVSHAVGRRRREIGIRMAVGAERRQVLRDVLGRGMALVLIGTALGLVLSLLLAPRLTEVLVSVGPREPIVYVGVTVLLLGVAGVANYLPARRAAGLDPNRILRDP